MKGEETVIPLPGDLTMETITPLVNQVKAINPNQKITVDCEALTSIDSATIAFFNFLESHYPNAGIKNLSPEFKKLFPMFPPAKDILDPKRKTHSGSIKIFLHKTMEMGMQNLGGKVLGTREKVQQFLVLLADEIFYTLQYLFRRRGIYPGETWNQIYFMAYKSYPIVALISFLVGITVSVTSAEQLRNFGADIYLADLVGYGMLRELVPLMTGIILAGKVGASITAELASMKVLEETDALQTMGVVPEKFLMVPRLLGITVAIPLLVAIADFVGIAAGVLVAKYLSGIPSEAFFNEMFTVVGFKDFMIGQVKTMVFGWVIVVCSGYKGFIVERSPTGVGIATTQSVVLSISMIIIVDCIFAIIIY